MKPDSAATAIPHFDRLAAVRLLGLDVDGVLTDGRLWYGADGEAIKAFHVHDGLGLKRLQAAGVIVVVISARSSPMVERRLDDLGIRTRIQGSQDKGAAMRALLDQYALSAAEAAFMGDDLPDLAAYAEVALKIAVANAQPPVRSAADWITDLRGGEGAVREVCEALLHARQART